MAKILGIDFGKSKTGIAISDSTETLATGKKIIRASGSISLIQAILDLCQSEGIEKIVIGYPIGLKGNKTAQTAEVESFAETLRLHANVPIEFMDERLTTVQAKKQNIYCGGKRVEDDIVAAEIILQTYLDKRSKKDDNSESSHE